MNRSTVLAAIRSSLPSLRPADGPQLVSVDALLEERARRQAAEAELAEANKQVKASADLLTADFHALWAAKTDRDRATRQVEQLIRDRSAAGQRHQATRDELDAMRARAEGAEQRIADALREWDCDHGVAAMRSWRAVSVLRHGAVRPILAPVGDTWCDDRATTSPPAAGTTEAATAAGDHRTTSAPTGA